MDSDEHLSFPKYTGDMVDAVRNDLWRLQTCFRFIAKKPALRLRSGKKRGFRSGTIHDHNVRIC
jgi:hypothetical protein